MDDDYYKNRDLASSLAEAEMRKLFPGGVREGTELQLTSVGQMDDTKPNHFSVRFDDPMVFGSDRAIEMVVDVKEKRIIECTGL